MKRICLCLAAMAIFLASCNNKKSPEQKIAEQFQDNMKDMAEKMNENKENMEKLQKLPPLSTDELKALIPETLMGAKRTSIEAASYSGTGSAQGKYKINDSTDIELRVYDCGGVAGYGFYSLSAMSLIDIDKEDEYGYTKTIKYGDGKATVQCQKSNNHCTLSWFTGERYWVSLEGDNVDAEALKQAGNELKFK